MIIVNAIVLHIPTTVLTCGSNGNTSTEVFVRGYNVMEKIQMCGFFLQEIILSSIYILETIRILRTSVKSNTKRLMHQLMAINILIIIMDLALLGLECASLYILETTTKPVFYSIKLKLEFAILGKLVHFVGGPRTNGRGSTALSDHEKRNDSNNAHRRGSTATKDDANDISEFVDLTKIQTDVTRTTQAPRKSSSARPEAQDHDLDIDLEIARMEHWDTLPRMCRFQMDLYRRHGNSSH